MVDLLVFAVSAHQGPNPEWLCHVRTTRFASSVHYKYEIRAFEACQVLLSPDGRQPESFLIPARARLSSPPRLVPSVTSFISLLCSLFRFFGLFNPCSGYSVFIIGDAQKFFVWFLFLLFPMASPLSAKAFVELSWTSAIREIHGLDAFNTDFSR